MLRKVLPLAVLFLLNGCLWPVRQTVDQRVCDLAQRPYDTVPEGATEKSKASTPAPEGETSTGGQPTQTSAAVSDVPTDVRTTAWMESNRALGDDVQAADSTELEPETRPPGGRKLDLKIPSRLPGSEAPRVELPRDKGELQREIDRIYPELPPLPEEPKVEPGPGGRAYTLSDLQSLAAANSPTLRQAVANVEIAKGNLVQARTYSNPTLTYLFDPSATNLTAGVQGLAFEQIIRTGGKQKLGVAAATQDVEIAELALKRSRSDLSTAVRSAYFTLLVDVETLAVTRALAQFTDDIYRLQTGLLRGALAAPYEPASLRAQAYSTRLAYRQAIQDYMYDWKKLVATIGLRQLPLTDVAGRVDRLIPYYDYDEVLAYALQNHTDVITARNTLEKSRYNLKLAQITPVPDLDARWTYERDKATTPNGMYHQFGVGIPLPVWDQNKGNIIAAQAGLDYASEESHRVEVSLTSGLAAAYASYRDNLYAIEYYRRYILPDLVRYYRGIYARRQVDPNSAFGDLVAAQQNLSSNITSYLAVLQNLWTSVVGVADYLQTDDLFQMARPRQLPELPDFSQPPQWPCEHGTVADWCDHGAAVGTPAQAQPAPQGGTAETPSLPEMRPAPADSPSAPPLPSAPTGSASASDRAVSPGEFSNDTEADRVVQTVGEERGTRRRGRRRVQETGDNAG
jgi:cobalt-zinc-cadmium efflux system outer membrane protein